jgi:hypothetical protein
VHVHVYDLHTCNNQTQTADIQHTINTHRGEEHRLAPVKKGITRMEMTIAANVLRPHPSDPSKTELTLLTHVNPGGLANTQFGAMVTNRLSAESPRQFIRKFNEVATGATPEQRQGPKRRPLAGIAARFQRKRKNGENGAEENSGGNTGLLGGKGSRMGATAAAVLAAALSLMGSRRRRDAESLMMGPDHPELEPEFVVSTARA